MTPFQSFSLVWDIWKIYGKFEGNINDAITRRDLRNDLISMLTPWHESGNIAKSLVVVDETNNPISIIDKNDLVALVQYQLPDGSIYYMELNIEKYEMYKEYINGLDRSGFGSNVG